MGVGERVAGPLVAGVKGLAWRRVVLAAAVLVLMGGAAWWLRPYALAAYHVEIGGRALEEALEPVFSDWLAPEQVMNAGRLDAAEMHLHKALRWHGESVQARRLLARVYLSTGRAETALKVLQEAVELRPKNPIFHLELGDAYDALGNTEAAIEAYEEGRIGSRGVPLAANTLKVADERAQQGSGDVAIELWQKTLEADPGNLYALYRLAGAHRELGDDKQAKRYEEQLRYFELESVEVPMDFRLAAFQGRAMAGLVEEEIWEHEKLLNVVSYQVWQFAKGVRGLMTERLLDTVLVERPEDADVLFYRGELYQRRGELNRAAEAYQQVVAVDGEYAQAYLRLGSLAEGRGIEADTERGRREEGETGGGNLAEAAAWYGRYHEVVPEDLVGLKRLAEVCGALKGAGVEDESCVAAAGRLREADDKETGGQGEGETPAAALWRHWRERAAGADPQFPVRQELDSGWTFLGYDVDEERLIRGEPVSLVLYWKGPPSTVAGEETDGWWRAGDRWVQVLEGMQNLVLNGGFELGYLGDGSPTGFPHDTYRAKPDSRRLMTDMRDGERTTVGLLVNQRIDTISSSFASEYFAVDPGAGYLQTGWLRSERGNGYLGRRWTGRIAEDVKPYNYAASGTSPENWTHYAAVTRPLEGASRCQVWLLNFRSAGRVYFDNVVFVRVGLPGT